MATNFPNGLTSMGIPLNGGGPNMGQGNIYFVKPVSGNDNKDGKTVKNALKTLAAAYAKCTANQDDTVYFVSEGNSATNASDRQSSTLTWAKDHTHLIGLNAGQRIAHRSRIAFVSSYATAAPLFTLSANGCLISGIEFYAGVASASPTYAMNVEGTRNHIHNCNIAGIGADEMDATGNASLNLAAGAAENYFENCVIGLDTIGRGSAVVTEIKFNYSTVGVARTIFKGCYITGFCASAGNYTWVTAGIGAIDRFVIFDDCIFTSPGTHVSGGAEMTYGMSMNSGNGFVILHNTSLTGCANVADNPANIVANLTLPTAADAGMTVVNVKN